MSMDRESNQLLFDNPINGRLVEWCAAGWESVTQVKHGRDELVVYATPVTTLLLPYPLWLSALDQLGWYCEGVKAARPLGDTMLFLVA